MGCCMSHSFFEKDAVYEVVLDPNGVAKRVSKGSGTHYVYISQDNETHLEEKSEMISSPAAVYQTRNKWSSLKLPSPYEKRVHPTIEEKPLQ
ncbi:hypothetical protein K501DRAFT_259814 [Backusella circina FSU 941]|nr:hypothetical protein K501DRAFT_259814 [Backusella circina FSU 941]